MNAPFLIGSKPKNARVFAKHPEHWYIEPTRVTLDLLRYERFVGPIWDPSCGSGNVLRACQDAGLHAVGSDIVKRVPAEFEPQFAGVFDFLTAEADPPNFPFAALTATNIICNPPYGRAKLAEAFIRKAVQVARGKLAFFVELRFLASASRAGGLFRHLCPHRVLHVAERPSCPPGTFLEAGGKAEGGQADYVWLVYDLTAPPVSMYQGAWIVPEMAAAT